MTNTPEPKELDRAGLEAAKTDIIKNQSGKLRRLRAEVRRHHSDFAFRQDPLNRKPGLYARIQDAKRERARIAARALNGGE